MADDKETEAPEPLSEEQRIAQLEKKMGTSKILLFAIALFLIIIISVSITAVSLFVFKDKGAESQETLASLQTEIENLNKKLNDMDGRLVELSLTVPELKGRITNTSNAVMQQVLIAQEKDIQEFLTALRSATYDLAHMVPGSRAWLELYSTQIDAAVEMSEGRVNQLKQLQTSAPITQDDPFFGEEF